MIQTLSSIDQGLAPVIESESEKCENANEGTSEASLDRVEVSEEMRDLLREHCQAVQIRLDTALRRQEDMLSAVFAGHAGMWGQAVQRKESAASRGSVLSHVRSVATVTTIAAKPAARFKGFLRKGSLFSATDSTRSGQSEVERASQAKKSEPSPANSVRSLGSDPLRHQSIAAVAATSSFTATSKDSMGLVARNLSARKSGRMGRIQQWAEKVDRSSFFNGTMSSLILLNTAFIGFETEWGAQGNEPHVSFSWFNFCFGSGIAVEISLRIMAHGWMHFFLVDSGWNLFDVTMLLVACVDLSVDFFGVEYPVTGGDVVRVVRVLRMFRAFRILRSVRHVREFRKMVFALQASMKTLLYSGVLVVLFMYVFAVLFTQGATTRRFSLGPEETWDDNDKILFELYGTLGRSFLSLYWAMSGGWNWAYCYEPTRHLHVAYQLLFLIFISLSIFGVLNVVTSVFVESAMTSASHYRDLIIQDSLHTKATVVQHLRSVFSAMDEDGDNAIEEYEMERFLANQDLGCYLEALDINATDARVLFRLLDRSGSGFVDIDEFCDGCLRVKGEAKSYDIHCMIYESTRLMTKWSEFMAYTEERLNTIDAFIQKGARTAPQGRKPKSVREAGTGRRSVRENQKVEESVTWVDPEQWRSDD